MDSPTSIRVDLSKSEKKKPFFLTSSNCLEMGWNKLAVCTLSYTASHADDTAEDFVEISDTITGEEIYCRICCIPFQTNEEFRKHYKDDLHRYNLKLHVKKRAPVSREEFNAKMDEMSSISGSESESDSEPLKPSIGSPKIYLKNDSGDVMAIFKCLLYHKKSEIPSDSDMDALLAELPSKNVWAIIILGGGHFAAGIYKGLDLIHHKTFHSYTVRAKQGGSQSSKDNKSGGGSHPKSAGASLRRYNEAAFAEHVQTTFSAWSDYLKECHFIFYRAASSNQKIMFGGKNPFFSKSDLRLRSIPFPTRRATLKEVKRVWQTLASVQFIESQVTSKESTMIDSLSLEETPVLSAETSDEELRVLGEQRQKRAQRKLIAKINSNLAFEDLKQDLETYAMFPGEKEIITSISFCIEKGDVAKFDEEIRKLNEILYAYKDEYHLEMQDVLNNRLNSDCVTLLHKAAGIKKRADLVWKLLELGCDPSLSDALGKVPYVVSADKDTRDCFRRFMGAFPDRYDYVKAAIPSPLTDEVEKRKQEKMAEKRKQQKQRQKEKKALEKARMEEERQLEEERLRQEEERRKVEEEKTRFLNLSDREKRALAAERRLLESASKEGLPTPVLVRCFLCAEDISGKIPFEYNQNKFCSPACLQKHRKLQQK